MANTTQQGYEEIDLIELLIKIYKFFKKRIVLILTSTIIAIGLGVAASFVLFQPRYQSTMIISSRSLTASEVVGMISTLDNLAREENEAEISKLTKIPENLAKKIEKIEALPNRDFQKNVEKDIRKDSTIAIRLEITQTEKWQIYQDGIAYYLENMPYVKKKTALYKEGQEKLLQNIQKEIRHLDSLKKIIEASGSGKVQLLLSNSGGIYSDILKLYEAEEKVKENLKFLNDIQIIKDFTNYKKPKKFSLRDTATLFAIVGFAIGIVLALVIELNKIIRKREGKE
jgi:capsular polysaccharide biosynthesis protein